MLPAPRKRVGDTPVLFYTDPHDRLCHPLYSSKSAVLSIMSLMMELCTFRSVARRLEPSESSTDSSSSSLNPAALRARFWRACAANEPFSASALLLRCLLAFSCAAFARVARAAAG